MECFVGHLATRIVTEHEHRGDYRNADDSGDYNFTLKVTDSGNPAQTATKALSITINPATLVITTTTLPNGAVGTVYNQTVMETGGTAPFLRTIKVGLGSLPAGLTLNNSTGNIGGTPLNGQYTFLAANGVQQIGGTFATDGAGNLSNCLLDFNDINAGPQINASCTGLYSLGHDHRACCTSARLRGQCRSLLQ